LSDEANRAALGKRISKQLFERLGPDMAAHPEEYTVEALERRFAEFDRKLNERRMRP